MMCNSAPTSTRFADDDRHVLEHPSHPPPRLAQGRVVNVRVRFDRDAVADNLLGEESQIAVERSR